MLLSNPKDWIPVERDGSLTGQYYCKSNPEYTINYNPVLPADNYLSEIETGYYWLKHSPMQSLHKTYLTDLEIKYHTTPLRYFKVLSADNNKFERILWEQKSFI